MPDPTDPTPPADQPPRKLSPQDKAIQAYATDADVFVTTASTDAEIRPLLEACGYDAADFATAQALIDSLLAAYQGRAAGMGKQATATEKQSDAIAISRDDYARFREIARASFPTQADRLALSLTGDVPEDTGRFITLARASYTAAGKAPHAAKLTKRGYPAATLGTLIAALDSFTETASEQDEAQGSAIGDTAKRDAAYDTLREFMKELKGVAKGALRGNPSLLAKLGL
jgi:hypothetical protein